MILCIDCNEKPKVERRRCKECCLIHNRKRAKLNYLKRKSENKILRYGKAICMVCNKELIKNRSNQTMHGKCKNYKSVSNYNKVPRSKKGNTIGRQKVLNTGLNISNFDVHHVDEDPLNNTFNNLLILSKSNHTKLHIFLREGRSLNWKQLSSNSENCWKLLRDQLTTTWLEKANVIRLKITDIEQSAAEPLNLNNIYIIEQEERSEAMH